MAVEKILLKTAHYGARGRFMKVLLFRGVTSSGKCRIYCKENRAHFG